MRLIPVEFLLADKPSKSPAPEKRKSVASTIFFSHTLAQRMRTLYYGDKLQLRTVKELTEEKSIECPSSVTAVDETFKKTPKAQGKGGGTESV